MDSLKGKLTEKEAKELVNLMYVGISGLSHIDEEKILNVWKRQEIIKWNPVEKAQNMWNDFNVDDEGLDSRVMFSVLWEAVNYLKKQLEDK